MRVLFVIPSMGMGGSETVFATLLRHMDADRFEAHLAVLNAKGPRLENVPPYVPVHDLHVTHARNAVVPLVRLCRRIQPQVILSTSAHMNCAVIVARNLMRKGVVLLTREGADIHSTAHKYSQIRLLAYKHTYRKSDLVICQSEHMKDNFIARFGLAPSKVATIYNPVDIELVRRLAASQPNPFAPGELSLVAVGRHSYEKGHDLLLRAMRLVRRVLSDAILTLIGEGPDDVLLRSLQVELGLQSSVRFLGLQRNPYVFIKNAQCLVLPSRTEALPNVVLEALALGTPVVASRCSPSLSEIASCAPRLYVAPDTSPEGLAAEIVRCVNASLPTAAVAPGSTFCARFGVEAVVRKYQQAFSIASSLANG